MDNDKLDKIIKLLEAIKANQEARQYYYPPIYYPPYQPYSNEPWPPPYPQPNWTYSAPETAAGNIYEC